MYFQECEHIANEQTDLRDAIARIDSKLKGLPSSSVLRTESIADILDLDAAQVEGIFRKLHEKGLLRREYFYECNSCSNLIDEDAFQASLVEEGSCDCSQCSARLDSQTADKVVGYRIGISTVASTKATDPISGSPSIETENLPTRIMKDPFKNTPLLRYYSNSNELVQKSPFAGKRTLFVLHFLLDLIPFVEACKRLGMDVKSSIFFYKEYPYPQRESIGEWLRKEGASVEPRGQIGSRLKQIADSDPKRIGDILVVEDGGFILPMIYASFPSLASAIVGAVEQTARGIWNDERIVGLRTSILSVATSQLKNDFEPPYIAEAAVNNIQRFLPNRAIRGKRVALLGFGTIGEKVANWMREKGANVTIYDAKPEKRLKAQQAGYLVMQRVEEAVKDTSIVIGSSGNESISSSAITSLQHATNLVSVSSEQYEINIEELDRMCVSKSDFIGDADEVIGTTYLLMPDKRSIHLLANGYPINFWGSESMPEEASDLILSLIFLSMTELAIGNYRNAGINANAVNEIAAKYEVAEKFQELHKR